MKQKLKLKKKKLGVNNKQKQRSTIPTGGKPANWMLLIKPAGMMCAHHMAPHGLMQTFHR